MSEQDPAPVLGAEDKNAAEEQPTQLYASNAESPLTPNEQPAKESIPVPAAAKPDIEKITEKETPAESETIAPEQVEVIEKPAKKDNTVLIILVVAILLICFSLFVLLVVAIFFMRNHGYHLFGLLTEFRNIASLF